MCVYTDQILLVPSLISTVPVVITDGPVGVILVVGVNVSLQCTASGIPLPIITWLKNGQLVQADSRVSILAEVTNDTPNEKIIVSSLVFQDLQLSDAAGYQCKANNTGVDNVDFTVRSEEAQLALQCKQSLTNTSQEIC